VKETNGHTDEINVSVKQIKIMRHMIGLNGQGKPRRGKYEAYRNFYAAGPDDVPPLEDLVDKGFVNRWSPGKFPSEYPIYSLNGMGLEFLGDICGLKITERR